VVEKIEDDRSISTKKIGNILRIVLADGAYHADTLVTG